MKLLDKYIAKNILSAIGLVTLMLAGLQIFILFVNELDSLGKGNYRILQVFFYVLLQMPYQVYLFFPMASLLGCLIGLGILANHRELVVMRAAGMSVSQITQAVFKAALILILLVTLIGETLIPHLAHYANDKKIEATSEGKALRTARGVWLKQGNDYISIGSVVSSQVLQDVFQFRFDSSQNLVLTRRIAEIKLQGDHWEARNIEETQIEKDATHTTVKAQMPWDVKVSPRIINGSMNEPDEMSLSQLGRYLRAQKEGKRGIFIYQMAYWQRLIQPLSTLVMMILAIPFIFGPLRASTMGSKFLLGVTIGFSFHLLNRFFGPISQVLQWPAIFAALGPTILFAILGCYFLQRVK